MALPNSFSIMSSPLPPGWEKRESKSKPGKYYYFNIETKESLWDKPPVATKHSGDDEDSAAKKPKLSTVCLLGGIYIRKEADATFRVRSRCPTSSQNTLNRATRRRGEKPRSRAPRTRPWPGSRVSLTSQCALGLDRHRVSRPDCEWGRAFCRHREQGERLQQCQARG